MEENNFMIDPDDLFFTGEVAVGGKNLSIKFLLVLSLLIMVMCLVLFFNQRQCQKINKEKK
ncbi:putative Co/Zn/Cd cation transporter (cation efflux family) [Rufibacter quisquiliarum]|uniref:Putative Co/Zn/Cd cation transporter (Cation efflux family) n=1 Tax=Rufibacter quisquiliarum TaxID=1549639 RepID=A0A839GF37_9BACT|nr:putative Co/Zn/Cd cation transporter (cation efflux family) [Rufibacter quisquiliarum]